MADCQIGEKNTIGTVTATLGEVYESFRFTGYLDKQGQGQTEMMLEYLQTLDLGNMHPFCIREIQYGLDAGLDVWEYADKHAKNGDWGIMRVMREVMQKEKEKNTITKQGGGILPKYTQKKGVETMEEQEGTFEGLKQFADLDVDLVSSSAYGSDEEDFEGYENRFFGSYRIVVNVRTHGGKWEYYTEQTHSGEFYAWEEVCLPNADDGFVKIGEINTVTGEFIRNTRVARKRRRIRKRDFHFVFAGSGHYKVTYENPRTGEQWEALITDMTIIDATKNTEEPSHEDLSMLKTLVIWGDDR